MRHIPVIAPRTWAKLAHPAPPGGRHAQIVELACALLGQGFNAEAVFCQLRPNYGPDVPDREIHQIIGWAAGKGFPARAAGGRIFRPRLASRRPAVATPPVASPVDCEQRIGDFLQGFTCGEADLWEASPVRLPEDWREDAAALLGALYAPGERINIVTDFIVRGAKASPKGHGTTRTREAWLEELRRHGPPESAAGAWVRMNPTDGRGIADEHVAAFRFALIEFDTIAPALQMPLIARLPLPVAAVLTSGGKSLHAWVRVNAPDVTVYRQQVSEMLTRLKACGVDAGNKNPSRLSRLPGAQRHFSAAGRGHQRLLYLNDGPQRKESVL